MSHRRNAERYEEVELELVRIEIQKERAQLDRQLADLIQLFRSNPNRDKGCARSQPS